MVGYRNGHVPLPIAPVRVTLQPSSGSQQDDRVRIQAAIDKVGNMPLQPFTLRDGTKILLRGAVLLQAGTYRVRGSLILNKDGVVLRGEGNGPGGTVVLATGDFVHDFIHLNGLLDPATQGDPNYQRSNARARGMRPLNHYVTGDSYATPVANEYVPVGSVKVPVRDVRPFKVGAQVVVERPATAKWIHMLGMDRIPSDPHEGTLQWDPRTFTLSFAREVREVHAQDPKRQAEAEAGLPKNLDDKKRGMRMPRYPNGETAFSSDDDAMETSTDESEQGGGEPVKKPQSPSQGGGSDGSSSNTHVDKSNPKKHDIDRDEEDWDDWGWDDWDWASSRSDDFHFRKRADPTTVSGEEAAEEPPERLEIDLPRVETSGEPPTKETSSPAEPTTPKPAPEPGTTDPDAADPFTVVRHHVNGTGDYILDPDASQGQGGGGGASKSPPSSSPSTTTPLPTEEGGGTKYTGDEDEDGSQPSSSSSNSSKGGPIPGHLILDIPLVMTLDPQYGGGFMYNYERQHRVPSDIGLENMQLISSKESTLFGQPDPTDEEHAWYGAVVNHCQNCWVADVTMRKFVSGVKAGTGAIRTTFQDCEVDDPVSKLKDGGRRYMFMLQGQLGLVKRCRARNGRHDFITGAKTTGPNVFVDSQGLDANNDAGPHDRWSVGTLYDNVHSSRINIKNRGYMGSGQGWAGAFHVMYHCDAEDPSYFQSPPGATNWVVAHNGSFWQTSTQTTFEGPDATYLEPALKDLFPINKVPRSLYWAQLVDRMSGGQKGEDSKVAMRVEELVGAKGRNRYKSI
ncbi:hypothetical protein DFQ27_003351 [Actinomortierella ambigua]|uniref:Uncharacterized protein n=1 Tax=Actinomortierella ambigua TaxID=1343610 RepID=A0A9P6U5M1_9FUNG|nr:hypothetical protein DFQ27_003351 [Actinomortierella ambigua]